VANRNYILWFLSAATLRVVALSMQNSAMAVTTPNPWGDGFDEGEVTISPRVSIPGENYHDRLMAALFAPPGKDNVGVVAGPAMEQHANMFIVQVVALTYHPPTTMSTPSAYSGISSSIPESGTNSAWIGILLLLLGLFSSCLRFRHR